MNKKNNVMAISAVTAGFVILAGLAGVGFYRASIYKNKLEQTYMRSVENATTSISNISTDLTKGIYASSPSQISMISAKLWKESANAKAALSALPITELNLDNTNKFLSQIGNYAMSLSKKSILGEKITDEEHTILTKLLAYCDKLNTHIGDIENKLSSGEISIPMLQMESDSFINGADDVRENSGSQRSSGSFKDMEDSFTNFPSLIYDGPFSDHLLSKKSVMTKDMPNVTKDDARKKAATAGNVPINELTNRYDENSKTPSYVFDTDKVTIAITKKGGLVNYMINSRDIGKEKIDKEKAFDMSEKYLESLGIKSLVSTYYEIANGIMTINYAYIQDGVTCYTDLIKVGVAMDNGDIVSFDARGFIVNHHTRNLPKPKLSKEEAMKVVNNKLKIEKSKLTLIPSPGNNEVLAYEFVTRTNDGRHMLIYINALNGNEEQILILLEGKDGVLTK